MTLPIDLQVPIAVAVGVLLLVLAAERIHQRRCGKVAHLASGPAGRPRRWVQAVSVVKALALAACTWSLATLCFAAGGVYSRSQSEEDRRARARHVVFVADLSPSMQLEDAGPSGNMTRSQRMHEVVDAVLRRLEGDLIYGVVAFYTEAMPVVVDAEDDDLVRNVFNDLPLWYVMEAGKTDLGKGVRTAMEHLADYPLHSSTVFICSDGDAIELGSIPKPPPSVDDVYVLGVGDPRQGTFIHDHMSRQDPVLLGTLAGRLGGKYVDVNEKHLSTVSLGSLALGVGAKRDQYGLVDLAIIVLAAAAAVHALIPVLLEYFGSDWKTVRVNRYQAREGIRP